MTEKIPSPGQKMDTQIHVPKVKDCKTYEIKFSKKQKLKKIFKSSKKKKEVTYKGTL